MKSPENKHILIPDENAPIVKRMFQMSIEGITSNAIARTLKKEGIPIPGAYVRDKNGVVNKSNRVKYPYDWQQTTVKFILRNEVYIGTIVNHISTTKSFKDKKRVFRPKDEWIKVENMHEPLVDKQTFYTVQERIKTKKRSESNPDSIFCGLLKCGECGGNLVFGKACARRLSPYYRCGKYASHGKTICTPHTVNMRTFKDVILEDINRHISFIASDKDKYAHKLMELSMQSTGKENASYKKEISRMSKRIDELNTLIQKIYEDKVFNRISEESYNTMSANMEKERTTLQNSCNEIENKLNTYSEKEKSIDDFIELISQFSPLIQLDKAILNTLIEKIVVHERQNVDGNIEMPVEIYYRFVGNLDSIDSISKK